MDGRKYLRGFVLLLIGFVVLGVIYWFYQTGTLDVTVSGGDDTMSVKLIEQSSGKEITSTVTGEKTSFRIKRGSYDVLAESGDKSYFSVTKVSGWLGKTSVSAAVQPEAGREFIGNNTGSCMVMIGETLVSYPCDGSVAELKVQIPATETSPPYTLSNPEPTLVKVDDEEVVDADYSASLEGSFVSNNETFVLVSFSGDNTWKSGHYLYRLTGDRKQAIGSTPVAYLSALSASEKYSLIPKGSGFIAFNTSFSSVFAFESATSEGSKLDNFEAESKKLGFSDAAADQNTIVALYSNAYDTRAKAASEIVIGNEGRTVHTKLGKNYTSVQMCGDGLVCLSGNGTDIFEVRDDMLHLFYRIAYATDLFTFGKQAYLQTPSGIIVFDISSRQGHVTYNQGSYRVETLTSAGGKLLLNVIDESSARYALLVTPGTTSDSIDKKFASLKLKAAVEGAVMYKNRIYITPRLAEPVFDPVEHAFVHTPAQISVGAANIDKAVKASGIDTTQYQIVNLSKY